jgi:hypothetical protein
VNDLPCTIDEIISFRNDLQEIATTIGKNLKPEQLVAMGFLLLSK